MCACVCVVVFSFPCFPICVAASWTCPRCAVSVAEAKKKTRKLRTFALRVDRRATEAKFPKAARPAASNRKNQQQRLKRQNPNEIAELNSTLDLDSGLCSLLNPSPPTNPPERFSDGRAFGGQNVCDS